jgi:hypothetical protein
MTKAPNPAHFIQVPLLTSPPTCTANLSATSIGSRFGLRGLDAIAVRQVAREDHSAAKAKLSSSKHTQRRKPTTLASTPSTPPLIVPPSNGIGSGPPSGKEPQGPSPVDYELKLKADFPSEMVLKMQEGVVRKAQKMVIKKAMGSKPTIKALQDCLKLHLPASYTSVTLLTRGFFEVLFTDEEGAKSTMKITAVEWSGLNLSFSRYIPNFDTSVQGAETLLSHTIKVQFLNLREQFKNKKTFTIMASKIGEVLEMEPKDSYIKRPIGPMIMVETCDINKLTEYIRIPSMAEGATVKGTTLQRILYSGLPNQCQKCR